MKTITITYNMKDGRTYRKQIILKDNDERFASRVKTDLIMEAADTIWSDLVLRGIAKIEEDES